MAAPAAQHPLEQYESLEVIGNGSFGVIRKVRRKSDGVILARKELNFERMTERDRKQIVAEVNILKDLCHENIVRYHDRYVDRDNGILYILMEYCGGGDLGTIIKNCARSNRLLPEDTIWSYFLQILFALQHCHFPSAEGSSSSGSAPRQQILHRDLKPDNVFLDANQVIKLGDFGLSKALGTASFANTYVGTPYYMSPELMQEKSYDTKSDIWSLGCLIYELCALKPPFHEAKTHNELSIFIRNGRIPPLPRGYSQALHQVIKAMLNINPAMRPSAQQLLQHERLELVNKVHETEKMLNLAKAHKQMLVNRERDLLLRERELQANEVSFQQRMAAALAQQEAEFEATVARRVAQREAELREAVMSKEEEVRDRMEKREAELLQAVVKREEELRTLWEQYELGLREELRVREEEVKRAEERLKRETEVRTTDTDGDHPQSTLVAFPTFPSHRPFEETPNRTPNNAFRAMRIAPETPQSVMHGVVLTDTGEMILTPTAAPHPVELKRIVLDSPRVKLDFGGIFGRDGQRQGRDYDEDSEDGEDGSGFQHEREPGDDLGDTEAVRKEIDILEQKAHQQQERAKEKEREKEKENISPVVAMPITRLRRPSIRASSSRPWLVAAVAPHGSLPMTVGAPTHNTQAQQEQSLAPSSARRVQSVVPIYDLDDEDGLPSPFLKRIDREMGRIHGRRGSAANELRAKAAVNAAIGKGVAAVGTRQVSTAVATGVSGGVGSTRSTSVARPSLERAKLASEEAKKALFRP